MYNNSEYYDVSMCSRDYHLGIRMNFSLNHIIGSYIFLAWKSGLVSPLGFWVFPNNFPSLLL